MREILFRGKRTMTGEWAYGWYVMYPFGMWPVKHSIIPMDEAVDGHYYNVQVDPETVGQYTGLVDRNGEKIFEGDVVNILPEVEETGVIKWDEDSLRFAIWADGFIADFANYWSIDLEIIGNIHDDPELLKEEAEK